MKAVAVITANEGNQHEYFSTIKIEKVIIIHFSGIRGGKKIPLRKTMAEALSSNQCPTVKSIFVMKRTENLNDLQPNDIILDEAIESFNGECQPEAMNSEDPLFILYTSGSTGMYKNLAND